jgi:hypothetical protein
VFVLFGLADFKRLLVQHIVESHMVLELLDDIIEDSPKPVLAFFAFINNTGVHMRIVVQALNIGHIPPFLWLSEYDWDDLPGRVILKVCDVLVLVQRWQDFISVHNVHVKLRTVKGV